MNSLLLKKKNLHFLSPLSISTLSLHFPTLISLYFPSPLFSLYTSNFSSFSPHTLSTCTFHFPSLISLSWFLTTLPLSSFSLYLLFILSHSTLSSFFLHSHSTFSFSTFLTSLSLCSLSTFSLYSLLHYVYVHSTLSRYSLRSLYISDHFYFLLDLHDEKAKSSVRFPEI